MPIVMSWTKTFSDRFDAKGYGTLEDVDVYDTFYEEFTTDADCDTSGLHWFYSEASPDERSIIDQVMIFLCGYSYPTLVEKSLGENH